MDGISLTTPPILGADHQPLPNSIAEAAMVSLGGMDQYVLIRGADVKANPLLVMLHGGPGISETAMWRYYNSKALEEDFTVIYWDQRGCGHSFDPSMTKEHMVVNQFLSDLDELIDYARDHCNRKKSKVVIFGHSWGSVLGPLYCRDHPEKVSLYVGCAQLGNWANSEKMTYEYTLSEAKRVNNGKIIRNLVYAGPPPHNADGCITQRTSLAALEGDTTILEGLKMAWIFLTVPEYSMSNLFRFYKELEFSIDATWSEVTAINLLKDVPKLEMPAIFMLGRKDNIVPTECSQEYIDTLYAPCKEIIWFEQSKHLPFVDEAQKFNRVMKEVIKAKVLTC